jgi:Fe-S cluster assembly protein SufD
MNADVRQIRTAAEQALGDAFAAARPRLPGRSEVAALRDAAFERFNTLGLPHRRVEEWKYTDLRTHLREAKPLAGPPDDAAKAIARHAGKLFAAAGGRRIVFADGAFVRELSDLARLEPGLTIRPMAEALAGGDPLVLACVGKVTATDDAAVALNTAFMGDGAVIHVADGATIERPIHLVFAAGEKAVAAFPRSLVVLGKGARLTLLESWEGRAGIDYQVNSGLELVVGDAARLGYVKHVREGDKALHIASVMAAVGAKADLKTLFFATGGAVVRNQLFVRFDGAETKAALSGVTMLRNRQHTDNTLVIDHAAGGCESRELFKTVLDDESRGVFQGRIVVRPHSQKTDAKMASHALLLSETAEADNKPELEIFADDVQCGHGATAGALDKDLLFYLKARGIPGAEAEALLIQAFVGEAIETIEHDGIKAALINAVAEWLEVRT